jgi:hypothetical protein
MVVMTTRARAVVLVVALALAASLLTLAVVLAKPAQAQAQTSTDTDRTPFSELASGCGPEQFLLEGTLQTVAHTTMDANGGFHTKFQFHLWGQGEGLDSGDKYVFNNIANGNIIRSPTGADLIAHETHTVNIIRQGSATTTDDLQIKAFFHITINAQGEVTAFVQKSELVCT